MIFKLTTMAKQEILVESESDLLKILAEANKGTRLILTRHGVVNASSIDSVVPWREKNEVVHKLMAYRKEEGGKLVSTYKPEEAIKEVVGPSPFSAVVKLKREWDEKAKQITNGNG